MQVASAHPLELRSEHQKDCEVFGVEVVFEPVLVHIQDIHSD